MCKPCLFGLFLFFSVKAISQDTLTLPEKAALDSMLANDEFLKMLDEKYSYVDVNLTAGNSFFSSSNNSINAVQNETQKIFFTPSIGYFHKSGLGISFSSYIANDNGKVKLYQHLVNPFWEFKTKQVRGSLSYTRIIKGSKTSFDASPFKNDIYANIELRKPWAQPGLAMGISNGGYTEYFDSVFILPGIPPRQVLIRDTIKTKLRTFSLTASVGHDFEFEKLFNKNDGILLRPSFLINASSVKYTVTHSNSLSRRRPAVQEMLKSVYGDGTSTDKFQIQSVAFLTEAMYSTGKFYLQPQLYLDYYLPETTGKRFTTVFSITAGFSFY